MKTLKWFCCLAVLVAGRGVMFAETATAAAPNMRLQVHQAISESATIATAVANTTTLFGPNAHLDTDPPRFPGVFEDGARRFPMLLDPATGHGRLANWVGMGVLDGWTPRVNPFTESAEENEWKLFLTDLDFGEPGTVWNWDLIVTAVPEPPAWACVILGGAVLGAAALWRFRT